MQIAGLQKVTLIDYPGHVAATVFTRGCNFRCPFCHNPELVLPEKFNQLIDIEEIFNYLKKRHGKLSGVCITGGEPLIQVDIEDFIDKIHDLGYKVKLDTNGAMYEKLKHLLELGKIDYVAMDIKTSPDGYVGLTQVPVQIDHIKKSIFAIINSGIDYEFRTTVVKPFHSMLDFHGMGEMLAGAKKYVIQNFLLSKHLSDPHTFFSFEDKELDEAKNIMKTYVSDVSLRV